MDAILKEWERAVLCAFDISNKELSSQALEFCSQIKNRGDILQLSLNGFMTSTKHEMKFHCLGIIQNLLSSDVYDSIPEDHKIELRTILMKWVVSCPTQVSVSPSYIRNKVAVIIALIIKNDFPEVWPTALNELILCLSIDPLKTEMALRALLALDEEVVDKSLPRSVIECKRNAEVKDAMRIRCMGELSDAWYNTIMNYRKDNLALVDLCLDSLSRYISWIDISIIANDRYVSLFFNCLNEPILVEATVDCLFELVHKGMPLVQKFALLQYLNLHKAISGLSLIDKESAMSIGGLVDLIGVTLIECWNDFQLNSVENCEVVRETMFETIKLVWPIFLNENFEVSGTVLQFLNALLQKLKTDSTASAVSGRESIDAFGTLTMLPALMEGIFEKGQYPLDYLFDATTEDDAGFDSYRTELKKMFMLITRILPEHVVEYLGGKASSILGPSMHVNSLLEQPHAKIEMLLSQFYWFGEALNPKQLKEMIKKGAFKDTIAIILNSYVYKHKHYCVVRIYLELVVRYSSVIEGNPALLEHVLTAMVGEGGIRNNNLKVRARTPYLLLKLCKSMKEEMSPYVEPILHGISDFLRITADVDTSNNVITVDNQMFLYELVGQLIVTCPENNGYTYFTILTNPLLSQMESIINNANSTGPSADDDISGLWMSRAVSALGYATKSFTSITSKGGIRTIFTKCLELAIQSIKIYPKVNILRSKVVFLLHCLVSCLDADILPYLPTILEILINACEPQDILIVITLLNQLIAKFRSDLIDTIDAVLMNVIVRVFNFTPKLEVDRDLHNELKRGYYAFLSSIVTHDLSNVFVSLKNKENLIPILNTLLQGCVAADDAGVSKNSYSILSKLFTQWIPDGSPLPSEYRSIFAQFMCEKVLPATFELLSLPSFDPEDAQSVGTLNEVVTLHLETMKHFGSSFSDYLSCSLPPQIANEYKNVIVLNNRKDLRNFLREFSRSMKKLNNTI